MKNDRTYGAIIKKAHEAGMEAGQADQPVPMIVGQATSLFGQEIDHSRPTYFVEGGVCGFASIHIKGNTSFGRWAAKNQQAAFRKAYLGGLARSVHEFGQSMSRKEAYARAFCEVLLRHNIEAHMSSRMD